jgi:mannosyl-oligosaccharide glucosidase
LQKTRYGSQRVSCSRPDSIADSLDIAFSEIKQSVDYLVEKYGQENPPPPFAIYTLKNNAGIGNHHLVQKTFEGDFEVRPSFAMNNANGLV